MHDNPAAQPDAADQPAAGVRSFPSGTGTPSDPPAPATGAAVLSLPTATTLPSGPAQTPFFIDLLHGAISGGFLSSAVWLDSFFGDERYMAESNTSFFKLRMEAFREGSSGVEYNPNFDLRLVLPQLRNKTRLEISGDPRDSSDLTTAPSPVPPATPASGDRRLTTALQYFLQATERHSFSVRAGLKLHKGTPVMFIGPRYRFYHPWDIWAFRFTQEVFWNTEKGWSTLSRFDLERPLPRELFFRSSLESTWSQDVHNYFHSVAFLVRQPLDHRRAIEYEWVNKFENVPEEALMEIDLVWRYRQSVWREWLFFEIAPQVRYPREFSFHATPGILFKLEAMFGRYR